MWKSVFRWVRYFLKQGNSLQNFKNRSQQPNIISLLSSLGSLYHHFKVHRVDIWLYIEVFWSKSWGSLWKIVVHWGRYILKQGNPLIYFKNHSHLPNIIILLSLFGSLYHNLKFHRVDIWLYWYFSGVRIEVICENYQPLGQIHPETGGSLTKFKNHSQLHKTNSLSISYSSVA